MGLFITKQRQRIGKRVYQYWVMKESVWDKEAQRTRQRYVVSIGPRRTITESRARELARKISEKLGREVTVEELRRVKKLRIVPDNRGNNAALKRD